MNDLYSAAVLVLLVVGLTLAAAHNSGVTIQFAEDADTSSHSSPSGDHSHPHGPLSHPADHGHIHGLTGE